MTLVFKSLSRYLIQRSMSEITNLLSVIIQIAFSVREELRAGDKDRRPRRREEALRRP